MIVHLNREMSHDRFEKLMFKHHENKMRRRLHRSHSKNESMPIITHRFKRLLNAIVVEGLSKSDLLHLEGVRRVVPDSKKKILRMKTSSQPVKLSTGSFSLPWGLDRIDQEALPLDGLYMPHYDGAGTDIYIVDTGIVSRIQLNHISSRSARFIYESTGHSSPGVPAGLKLSGTRSPEYI